MNKNKIHPYNAQTEILFEKGGKHKSTNFSYTQDISIKNDWIAYANHSVIGIIALFFYMGMMGWTFYIVNLWFPTLTEWTSFFPKLILSEDTSVTIGIIIVVIIFFIQMITIPKFLGGISVLLHHNITKLRDTYPQTNAWSRKISLKFGGKRVGLSPKHSPRFTPHSITLSPTELLVTDYDIVYQRFYMEPDCSKKIQSIKTICVAGEESRKKVQVMDFYLLFTFNSQPDDYIVITTTKSD